MKERAARLGIGVIWLRIDSSGADVDITANLQVS
jgi:hypothetical protein